MDKHPTSYQTCPTQAEVTCFYTLIKILLAQPYFVKHKKRWDNPYPNAGLTRCFQFFFRHAPTKRSIAPKSPRFRGATLESFVLAGSDKGDVTIEGFALFVARIGPHLLVDEFPQFEGKWQLCLQTYLCYIRQRQSEPDAYAT